MTAKLAVTILVFGLMAAALLSTRQARLQAAHEVTAARLRIRVHDERLLEMRARVAERVAPARVREMLDETGQSDDFAPLAERVRTLDGRFEAAELVSPDGWTPPVDGGPLPEEGGPRDAS